MAFHPAYIPPTRMSLHNAPLMVSWAYNDAKRGKAGGAKLTFYLHAEVLRRLGWRKGAKLRMDLDVTTVPVQVRLLEVQSSPRTLRSNGGEKLLWACPYLGDAACYFPARKGVRLKVLEMSASAGLVFEVPGHSESTEAAA